MDIQLLTHTSMSNTNIMNSFGLKLVASAAIAGTITIAMGASAEAAGLTGTVDFAWKGQVTSSKVDFQTFSLSNLNNATVGQFNIQESTGDFGGLATGEISDITLAQFNELTTSSTSIANFIKLGTHSFTLQSVIPAFSAFGIDFDIAGVFEDGTLGKGSFNAVFQAPGSTKFFYEANLKTVAVPSPVLLPGLIGLGFTALRKRKQQALASV
jgi:hypothetical protein